MADTSANTKKVKEQYAGYTNTREGSVQKIYVRPRQEVRILSETYPEKVEKRVKVAIKRDSQPKILWKDENSRSIYDHTSETLLWMNDPFSLLLPRGKSETFCTFSPDGKYSNDAFKIPLHAFMNDLCDPVKIYYYKPEKASSGAGTSYFKSIGVDPIKDDGSSMLFIQQMKSRRLNLPDGPVQIDQLSEKQIDNILKEILGEDYLSHVEAKKKEEGGSEKNIPKSAVVAAKAGYKTYDKLIKTKILQDFGYKGKFYIQTVKGQQYVVFKGYAGLRKHYNAPRYKVTNPKVLNFTVAGKMKTAMKGNGVTLLIVGAIDIFEYWSSKDNDKQLSDLCVQFGMDALKTVVASLIAAGVVAGILAGIALIGWSAPVLLIVAGAIAIGIAVGLLLDFVDEETGATKYMKIQGRKGQAFLEKQWTDHVVEPLGRFYYQLERSIEGLYFNGSMFRP